MDCNSLPDGSPAAAMATNQTPNNPQSLPSLRGEAVSTNGEDYETSRASSPLPPVRPPTSVNSLQPTPDAPAPSGTDTRTALSSSDLRRRNLSPDLQGESQDTPGSLRLCHRLRPQPNRPPHCESRWSPPSSLSVPVALCKSISDPIRRRHPSTSFKAPSANDLSPEDAPLLFVRHNSYPHNSYPHAPLSPHSHGTGGTTRFTHSVSSSDFEGGGDGAFGARDSSSSPLSLESAIFDNLIHDDNDDMDDLEGFTGLAARLATPKARPGRTGRSFFRGGLKLTRGEEARASSNNRPPSWKSMAASPASLNEVNPIAALRIPGLDHERAADGGGAEPRQLGNFFAIDTATDGELSIESETTELSDKGEENHNSGELRLFPVSEGTPKASNGRKIFSDKGGGPSFTHRVDSEGGLDVIPHVSWDNYHPLNAQLYHEEVVKDLKGAYHEKLADLIGLALPPQEEEEENSLKVAITTSSEDMTLHTQRTSGTAHSLFTVTSLTDLVTMVYLGAFAVFGETIRVYTGRLFGTDCENYAEGDGVNDFFFTFAKHVCVTSSGTTSMRGGAVFADLPANILGCFIMGVMTSLSSDWPAIPWLSHTHPLQEMGSMHVAIRTGLCGSLTTFASWNSQMVMMLDGNGLPLGSQVASAIFGYIIGLQCAIASFLFGRHVSGWLNRWRNPHLAEEADEEAGRSTQRRSDNLVTTHCINRTAMGNTRFVETLDIVQPKKQRREEERGKSPSSSNSNDENDLKNPRAKQKAARIIILPTLKDVKASSGYCCCRLKRLIFNHRTTPFILLLALLILYIFGDTVAGIPFYRTKWISLILSPPGAIMRWKLSKLNGRLAGKRSWVPVGTFTANVLGSVISIACVAIIARLNASNHDGQFMWTIHWLAAAKTGFAGSLSTVSTFVKEIVDINERYSGRKARYIYYGIGTIICCCLLSLSIYSPLVRL